ncbi:MAG: NAD(P)H-dependent oxidoreductase [Verrucomicrobia bacterium]|nr:NAD(P)H-dependent oxidoreductase [Verrucomicrobiota bacterium]
MNAALTPAQLLASLEWRYATKAFDTRKLPDATWAALEESLRLTPSSFGLQPWKFIVVNDPAVRAKLRPVSWNQSQVTDASHLVVFARRTEMTEADVNEFFGQIVSDRKIDAAVIEPYRQMMLGGVVKGKDAAAQKDWAARQLYIALGQLMGAAAALAVDTCALEGIDPAAYTEILGLKGTGYEVVVACAVGYRSAEDKYASLKKVRYPAARVISRV